MAIAKERTAAEMWNKLELLYMTKGLFDSLLKIRN
jgi:hypothetical protein